MSKKQEQNTKDIYNQFLIGMNQVWTSHTYTDSTPIQI